MRKLLVVISILFLSLVPGCCMNYSVELTDDAAYGVSDEDAFIGEMTIELTEETTYEFTVPDTFNGVKVTKLGGYHGRGVPTPFEFCLKYNGEHLTVLDYIRLEEDDYIDLDIIIHLGKYVNEFQYVYFDNYYGIYDEETNDVLFRVHYIFDIDSENEYLYYKDGIVYNKQTDEIIYKEGE